MHKYRGRLMRHIEARMQEDVFNWAKYYENRYEALKLLNASMNGVKLSSTKAGARAKRQGLKAGFPDIFLPVAKDGFHGLFIELKTPACKQLKIAKGVLSNAQKECIEALKNQGYKVEVCYGAHEAIDIIKGYIRYEASSFNGGATPSSLTTSLKRAQEDTHI